MLGITELKNGTKFIFEGEPFSVLKYEQSKMGRGGSIVKVRIQNLKTGAVFTKTFQGAEKLLPADLSKTRATFLYLDSDVANFMDLTSYEQFSIPTVQIGDQKYYLKEGAEVDILNFQNEAINIELPIKMDFLVVEAPPAVRGNSAGTVTKKVKLETGTEVDTPLFVKEGDIIVVDTRDGSYVERKS